MVQSPSFEANWSAASQDIPRISRNPNVHYRTHNVRHLSLSWASPIQSLYTLPTSWRSILILSAHLHLGLPVVSFPPVSPPRPCTPPSPHPYATCPVELILLDFITRTMLGEQYKSFSSSLCILLHSPVTSSLLVPNILLNTMFSNTFNFLSSRNISNQVSHPYKTTGKIISWSLNFWIATWKTKDSAPNYSKHFLNSLLSLSVFISIFYVPNAPSPWDATVQHSNC